MKSSQYPKLSITANRIAVISFVIAAVLIGALLLDSGRSGAGSLAPHGVVPIGSTNEGGAGAFSQPSPGGIIDITAGPCTADTSSKTYETISSRVTLLRRSKVVAKWEIYGEQRIAWVVPVGEYFVRSSQPPFTKPQMVIVSRSRVATVNLLPACP